jgi:signal transduction histidine kinase
MDEIKVLLVEDNPVDAFMVRTALERSLSARFSVDSADRLGTAIAQAGARPTDVLLLDLGLPDVEGLETFVRARAALPNLPILVLSGHDDEELAIQSVQQGAQDYLLKGATIGEALPRAIRYALERHRAQEQLHRYALDLRKKDEELARSEKLASLGMLAAGVAHEIRNPLTAIKAAIFLQLKKAPPGSPDRADLDLVSGEISRLEHIVRDFLQFARPAEPRLMTTRTDQPLRQVQTLMAPQLAGASIALILEPSPAACIRIDPEQIEQVLINLVQNAAEAIGHDGTITLRARRDTRPLAGSVTEVVVLEVSDTGPGIPPEVEKRLFDPFFSTKRGGTGLGLSIGARLVEQHGGVMQYQTQPNRGTTFGIVLPGVDGGAMDEQDRQNPAG